MNDIFILHKKADVNATMLDDDSLGKMISAFAQVLCNVHYQYHCKLTSELGTTPEGWKKYYELNAKIPLQCKVIKADKDEKWEFWAFQCLANYNRLLEYALACCEEYSYRFCSACDKCRDAETELEMIECGKCLGRGVLPWTKQHKLQPVIEWCANNVPDLPINTKRVVSDIGDRKDILYGRKVIEYIEAATPFPLVMMDKLKKYYIKYANGYKDFFTKNDLKKEGWDMPPDAHLDAIESYRNYYRAKLKKMARKKCPSCDGKKEIKTITHTDGRGYYDACNTCIEKVGTLGVINTGYITQPPSWARREKPCWLGDL